MDETTGLREVGFQGLDFTTWLGKVDAIDHVTLESELQRFNCRNNKLAKLGLDNDGFREAVDLAINEYGSRRIAVFMGTSTSGKAEAEQAYCERNENGELPHTFDMLHSHNIASVQDYVQHSLGLNGLGFTISTACSSSAKVFASAYRFIQSGLCDAAVIGGVDSLCLSTLYGFRSLQLVSDHLCQPWDKNRKGINIGEAAGFALLEKSSVKKNGIKLLGFGESSDAYHMSTPHPQGKGAQSAMQQALFRSGLRANDIGYVNLHGTATASNDAAEAKAMNAIFKGGVSCSSTKGITGHTLGAAGITEAIICCLALENNFMPANINLKQPDEQLAFEVLLQAKHQVIKVAMSNSFGFGGTNCSLVFSC